MTRIHPRTRALQVPIAQEGDIAGDLIIIVDGSVSVAQPSQAAVTNPQASGLDPDFSLDGSKFEDGSKFGDGLVPHRSSVMFSLDGSKAGDSPDAHRLSVASSMDGSKPMDSPGRPLRSSVLFPLDEAKPMDSPSHPQQNGIVFSADGSHRASKPLPPTRWTGALSGDGSHRTCNSPRAAWADPFATQAAQEPLSHPRPSIRFSLDNSKSLELLPHRQSIVNASAIKIARMGGGWSSGSTSTREHSRIAGERRCTQSHICANSRE